MKIEACLWSTQKIRRSVMVEPSELGAKQHLRNGSDKEMIADFGTLVGLILSTHWGPTPLGVQLDLVEGRVLPGSVL